MGGAWAPEMSVNPPEQGGLSKRNICSFCAKPLDCKTMRPALILSLATCLTSLVPSVVQAHPHIFVDAGFFLKFDEEDRLVEVKVTWQYDDFYSLLVTEDLQIDRDGDGILTESERLLLTGFDTNWAEGFNGDLELRAGADLVALSGPLEATTDLRDGRITSTHIRRLHQPLGKAEGPISLKAFDPSYYTAYEIRLPVTLSEPLQGQCLLERIEPDIMGALAEMEAQLLRIDADADLEENDIPMMGGQFATEILVSCPTS